MTCPVCGSNSPCEFLFRERVTVHQNLLMRDQAAAMEIPRGELALIRCPTDRPAMKLIIDTTQGKLTGGIEPRINIRIAVACGRWTV